MATISVAVTDTNDDGYEFVGIALVTNDLRGGRSPFGDNFIAFVRLQNVEIPEEVAVTTATLTINVTLLRGAPNTEWYGVDVDDAPAFASPGNLPSNATRTTASTAFAPTSLGVHQIDVTSIVQEIVSRPGWQSGNDIAFVCAHAGGDVTGDWVGEDFSAGGDHPVQLDTAYTVPPESAGVVYRYSNANNYWRAFADITNGQIVLEKVFSGVVTEVATAEVSLGSAGEIRVIAQGDRHRIWWDYHLVIDVEDSALNSATLAGLYSAETQSISFRDWYAQGL